jgi:hypothetical protein
MAHFVIGWLRNTSYYLFGSGSSGLGTVSVAFHLADTDFTLSGTRQADRNSVGLFSVSRPSIAPPQHNQAHIGWSLLILRGGMLPTHTTLRDYALIALSDNLPRSP